MSTRSSPPDRRSMTGSRSLQASGLPAGTASTSRPFLNMINPMGRAYQGYTQANQSVLEEEDEEQVNLEAGRRVSFGEASQMNVLRSNIRQQNNEETSSDDEVPQSFMIEATTRKGKARSRHQPLYASPLNKKSKAPPAIPADTPVSIPPRPSELDVEEDQEPVHHPETQQRNPMRGLDAHQRALWNWVNVYNLDEFLQEVYYYYEGKGIFSIALARGLNLLTVGFVIGFSTFLLGCVDYSRIKDDGITRLGDIVVSKCVSKFSGFTFIFFVLFSAFYVWQIVSFVLGIIRLVDMYNFYTHLLRIPDADIQTISWPEIVRRIGAIREANPLTAISSTSNSSNATAGAKLDAHDIANRIMRQENYLIALFNKELLDLRVPVPPILQRLSIIKADPEEGKGKTLTRALEWNLRFCLMEYLFDPHGRVRKVFLKSKNRKTLIEGLRRRFIFMGILNAIFAPFIVLYLLMYSFFRYFEEYRNNPSSIGGRRYTPFAQWKFREFNELPHLFARRLNESYPDASMYIGQFPNEKMTLLMRFIAFVAGSFAAVLLLASVIDPDLFLHFEITPHRTVLFYLGVFTSVLAVARGMIPEDNRVFDPELLMMEVIGYTHYMPDEWKGMLHSKKVHQEFGQLFAMKIMIFAQELVSVILTPFVLWQSLPTCAPAIIDFFHDFTVHVDGRGYICGFAEFNFQRHGNVKFGAPTRIHDQRMVSNEGKMEKSFLNFKAANPDWNPTDPTGSLYLSRMADFSASYAGPSSRRRAGFASNAAATAAGLESTVLLPGERKKELADRAQEYDRALRQSQHAAARRRTSGSVMGGFGMSSSTAGSMAHSTGAGAGLGAVAMAQTTVLGDSHGSEVLGRDGGGIADEDLAPDGGVGSGLGESYVDGTTKEAKKQQQDEEEELELEDGGVLGLLAQIYGAKGQGPARVI